MDRLQGNKQRVCVSVWTQRSTSCLHHSTPLHPLSLYSQQGADMSHLVKREFGLVYQVHLLDVHSPLS